jgi:hypothetical protein
MSNVDLTTLQCALEEHQAKYKSKGIPYSSILGPNQLIGVEKA